MRLLVLLLTLAGCGSGLLTRSVAIPRRAHPCQALCDRYFRPGAAAASAGPRACRCWAPVERSELSPRDTIALITWRERLFAEHGIASMAAYRKARAAGRFLSFVRSVGGYFLPTIAGRTKNNER